MRQRLLKYMRAAPRRIQVLLVGVAAAALSWGLAWVGYRFVAVPLIAGAYYERRPFHLLSGLLAGRGIHPLSLYLSYAEGLYVQVAFVCAVVVSVGGVMALLLLVPEKHLRQGLLLVVICLVSVSAADRLAGGFLELPRAEEARESRRMVVLRLRPPHLDATRKTSPEYLKTTDGLASTSFRERTDAHGFLLPGGRHSTPDMRLFFLGGSTTECLHVGEDRRFPGLVGRLLEEQTGLMVNTYNGGVSGNNSLHSLTILLNVVMPQEPDGVVLMHNINDLVTLLYTGSYWADDPARAQVREVRVDEERVPRIGTLLSGAAEWLLPHMSYQLKRREIAPPGGDEWAHIRREPEAPNTEAIRQAFAANLRSFVDLCRHRGVTPVLMTQHNRLLPEPDAYVREYVEARYSRLGLSYEQFSGLYRQLNDEVRSVAANHQVPLIDLAEEIPPTREYMYDPVHLNDAGSTMAGGVIAQALLALPIAQSPPQGD